MRSLPGGRNAYSGVCILRVCLRGPPSPKQAVTSYWNSFLFYITLHNSMIFFQCWNPCLILQISQSTVNSVHWSKVVSQVAHHITVTKLQVSGGSWTYLVWYPCAAEWGPVYQLYSHLLCASLVFEQFHLNDLGVQGQVPDHLCCQSHLIWLEAEMKQTVSLILYIWPYTLQLVFNLRPNLSCKIPELQESRAVTVREFPLEIMFTVQIIIWIYFKMTWIIFSGRSIPSKTRVWRLTSASCSTRYRKTTSSRRVRIAVCSGNADLLLNMLYVSGAGIASKSSLVKSSCINIDSAH